MSGSSTKSVWSARSWTISEWPLSGADVHMTDTGEPGSASLDILPDGSAPSSALGGPIAGDYLQLRQRIRQQGLLDRQPRYYLILAFATFSMAAVGLLALGPARNSPLLYLDAVFLAVVWGQLLFLGHDAAHRQIFRAGRKTDLFCLITGNLILGVSQSWWTDKHNRHHAHPNQVGHDPDIELIALAFSDDQARNKQGILRLVARYQAYLFFPLLTLEGIALQVVSIAHVARNRIKYRRTEALLLAGHHILFFGLLLSLLGVWRAAAVFAIQQALLGVTLGCSFAPNHKGMPLLEKDSQVDFLRQQVLTSRNIRPNLLVDYLYGGLNYQIEHHLFPTMPRNRLGEARHIVRAFCDEKGISYYEAGVLGSFREVLTYFHQVGTSA